MTPRRAVLAEARVLLARGDLLQRRHARRVRARLGRLALALGAVELLALAAGLGGAL